jgi:hypothetical protein
MSLTEMESCDIMDIVIEKEENLSSCSTVITPGIGARYMRIIKL